MYEPAKKQMISLLTPQRIHRSLTIIKIYVINLLFPKDSHAFELEIKIEI